MITRCKIVLSSSWRFGGLSVANDALKSACVGNQHIALDIIEAIVDKTPLHVEGKFHRGHEIAAWLDTNAFKGKFAILDDNSDMLYLTKYLVQTSSHVGLTQNDADKIINLLS